MNAPATDDDPATAKARAEAESARIQAERQRAEFEEWQANATQRRLEAEASLEATRLKNAEATRAGLGALVPDLGAVKLGSTETSGTGTVFSALLGGRALEDAARGAIASVKGSQGLGDDYRVLVTSDLDLASRDLELATVRSRIERLRELVAQQRSEPPAARSFVASSVALLAAQALPGILSLAASRKKLSTETGTVDDTVAVMAVAGALATADPGATVVVDAARLTRTAGPTHRAWEQLQAEVADLAAAVDAREDDPAATAWVKAATAVVATCRQALDALVAVPEGGRHSALALASLQDSLHDDTFGGVLVVKGSATSSTQLLKDRAFFGDPISVVATATIAYLLIDHRHDGGGKVLRGGLWHGSSQMHGEVGSALRLPS